MSTQPIPPSLPSPVAAPISLPAAVTPDQSVPAQSTPEVSFTEVESDAIAWRKQNFIGACDGTNAAEVPGAPDLHLVFHWEDDLCFLSIFPSENGRPVRAYYRGFQKKPPSRAEALGRSRNVDMNLDLSKCSAEDAAKVLSSPKRVFKEIEDAVSGKFTDKDVHFHDAEHPVTGADPVAYTRSDDWQRSAVETGPEVFKEQKAPSSRHTGSKAWTSDGDGDITSVTPLNELLNGCLTNNPGFELEKIPRETCRPRKDAPRWVVDEQKFNKFVVSQGDSAALDRAILYDYYMIGSTDEEVFTAYKAFFTKEEGRQRRTSSVGAVKKRRQRLVDAGNAFYAEAKSVSEPRGQARPVKRAFPGLVGR